MFATAARWAAKKGKPNMAPIELTASPEQAQSSTRTIFDVVREHGPLTISDVWEHVKGVGHRGLTSKRQMKIMLRWMREKQRLRLICDLTGLTSNSSTRHGSPTPRTRCRGPRRTSTGSFTSHGRFHLQLHAHHNASQVYEWTYSLISNCQGSGKADHYYKNQ